MQRVTVLALINPNDARNAHLPASLTDAVIVVADGLARVGEAARRADAILVYWAGRDLLEPVLALCPGVRWVHSIAAGVDRLMVDGFAERAIVVTNSRGVFSASLAEFTLAAILHFAKDIPRMRRAQAQSIWNPFEVEMAAGKTLGVLGYGDIGRAAARLARGLGMDVVALRRRAEPVAADPAGAAIVTTKGELLARSDYVLLAAPLTPETHHMIGAPEIAAMKPTAVLINVGRGPLVDESALVQALRDRRIRGAALDVFEVEPLPSQHPLFGMDNVLVSPHCADRTDGWLRAAVACFEANLRRFVSGEPLQNLVDVRAGY
jgi:phosphoglycerate dehydrogenase-like enzyme